jgi:acyl-CoA thioesterase I
MRVIQAISSIRRHICRFRMQHLLGILLVLATLQAAEASTASAKIMVFGDSLSAAYGLSPQQGWVALLADKLATRHPPIPVVNASISGETTRGGLARIATDLTNQKPTLVLLELGANDSLRGLPVRETRNNLEALIRAIRKTHAKVILIGLQIPPNYGPDYAREFREMYPQLAKKHQLALVPFLLEGIAEQRELFQADGLHPIAAAQPRLLANVWPLIEAELGK